MPAAIERHGLRLVLSSFRPPKKSPLAGKLIRPSSHGEDVGEEWIKRSVSPYLMQLELRREAPRSTGAPGAGEAS